MRAAQRAAAEQLARERRKELRPTWERSRRLLDWPIYEELYCWGAFWRLVQKNHHKTPLGGSRYGFRFLSITCWVEKFQTVLVDFIERESLGNVSGWRKHQNQVYTETNQKPSTKRPPSLSCKQITYQGLQIYFG